VPVVTENDARLAATEIDSTLGIAGSAVPFLKQLYKSESKTFNLEEFVACFWEVLWQTHNRFGQMFASVRAAACQNRDPLQTYKFVRQLGRGVFGTVQLAMHKETRQKRAIKIVKKSVHYNMFSLETEVGNLQLLDHPNIVKLYEHYEDDSFVYLVMDFCSGGELQETINRSRAANLPLPEDYTVNIIQQLLMAIAHVHVRGIVHLDLKPANIMLTPDHSTLPPAKQIDGKSTDSQDDHRPSWFVPRPHVMVIDLGVAQIFRPGDARFSDAVGTPTTMAPEVWRGEITPKADVFSSGVVFFEMLALQLPFDCGVDKGLAISYWNSSPQAPWELIDRRSQLAVGLCRRMLIFDRFRRPNAQRALQSSIFERYGNWKECRLVPRFTPELTSHLLDLPKRSVLHRSVALAVASVWPANQLPTIKRIFRTFDLEGVGNIQKDIIIKALKREGVDHVNAIEIVEAMDLNRDEVVEWTEFVAGCIDLSSENLQDDLRLVFQQADADGDGLLTRDDVVGLLPEEQQREEVVADTFRELSGRSEEEAKVDWTTFLRHFQPSAKPSSRPSSQPTAQEILTSSQQDDPVEVLNPALANRNPGTETLIAEHLAQARSYYDWAVDKIFPKKNEDVDPGEDVLQRLHDMGFMDDEKNIAVLRKHRNRLCNSTFEDLCAS